MAKQNPMVRLREIESSLNGGRLGVAAVLLSSGEAVLYQADAVFPMASTIKAVIVAELYAQLVEGRLPAEWFENAAIPVLPGDCVGGSGVLSHLTTPDLRLSLADLALLAIKVSDNTASNLCLRTVGGPKVVNERMFSEWGMTHSRIHRPIKFHLTESDPPHTATGTPRCMCMFLERVAAGRLHSREVCLKVEELLSTVSDAEMLPRYLNVNYYASDLENERPTISVAHKPGAVTGVRNDVGIVRQGEESLVIAIYTSDCPDTVWTPANRGSEAVAQVGRFLCDYFFDK